ncbi:hypothetical protein YC2023_116453 [Brassica napus]
MAGKLVLRCLWWPRVSQNFCLLCPTFGSGLLRLFLSSFVCRSGGVASGFSHLT